ncbi:Leukocyte surface antigen CD47 [Myotis davidii]|uniref:Leukocyte surface antigen CD47 n=1 Tax=Myotis davidii TaxID=225400 RepID=L5MKA5_MYODS|nr:Leukocyte surface antigen CD47 [Myotis davidii]
MLAVLLFWGQFGIVTLKYNASVTKERTILLFVAGLVLTTFVIVGAILFVPGEYSTKRASGLGLIVVPTVILILLQYSVFMIAPAIGMSSFSITILILQVLGFVLSVVGLSLCVSECTPMHGPLLISGLGIIALAELLGLVYMKFVGKSTFIFISLCQEFQIYYDLENAFGWFVQLRIKEMYWKLMKKVEIMRY